MTTAGATIVRTCRRLAVLAFLLSACTTPPQRVLGPDAVGILQRAVAGSPTGLTVGSLAIRWNEADLELCQGATGACWTSRLERPTECTGTVAGPWCVRFLAEAPPDALKVEILALLAGADAWSLPTSETSDPPSAAVSGADAPTVPGEGVGDEPQIASLQLMPHYDRKGFDDWTPLAGSVPAWSLLLFAVAVALRGGRKVSRDLGLRSLVPWLVGIGLLSLALRLLFAHPQPINPVEMERLTGQSFDAHSAVIASLLAPFVALFGHPFGCHSVFNLLASVASPVALALLAAAWGGRTVGVLAGLVLAAAPEQIHWAMTSDAGVSLTGFLLAAVLATEVFVRRARVPEGLAAGIFWGLAFHLRPETPGMVLALAAWIVASRPFRAVLGRPRLAVALLGPVVLSLALDAFLSATSSPIARFCGGACEPSLSRMVETAHSLLLNPAYHYLPWTVLWLAGLALLPGPALWVSLVIGLFHPVFLAQFGGFVTRVEPNIRYMLFAQPFLALAAARALARLWESPTRPALRTTLRVLVVLLVLSAPVVLSDYAGGWSALQRQYRFVSEHLESIPEHAVLVVQPDADQPNWHVQYQLAMAGRWNRARTFPGCLRDPGVMVVQAADLDGPIPPGCPVLLLEGFTDHAHPEDAAQARARLGASWDVDPVVTEVAPVLDYTADQDLAMRLGLFRLSPKTPVVDR